MNGVPNSQDAFKYWGYIPTNGITAPEYDDKLNAKLDANGDTIWVDYEYSLDSHIAAAQKYADAIEKGQGIVDYRNALTDYYADDLYNAERNCLYGASSVQEYLESVGAIYKAKANSFNKG